jgi:short-subunit dehydrogenase
VPAARVSELHRTAFVTGASTGLGAAFAEMLLRDGVKVWGSSRDVARLAGLTGRYPGQFTAVALDLRQGDRAAVIFREAEVASGGFDLVINNAGYGVFADFTSTDFKLWEDQLQVMLINTARMAQAALRGMRERDRGRWLIFLPLPRNIPCRFRAPTTWQRLA